MFQWPMKKSVLAASAGLIAVFIIDMFLPLGIAVGVLYSSCFFVICTQRKRTILLFTLSTTSLILFKFWWYYSPSLGWIIPVNRAISILSIWVIAVFALRHRVLFINGRKKEAAYISSLERVLFMASHDIRKPICTAKGLMELIKTGDLKGEEIGYALSQMKISIDDLDKVTGDLTKYLYRSEIKTSTNARSGPVRFTP
jgi:hypothetical protein